MHTHLALCADADGLVELKLLAGDDVLRPDGVTGLDGASLCEPVVVAAALVATACCCTQPS